MYEIGPKGLSHVLVHAREDLECGGHHGAFNTAVAETAHKDNLKVPATFAKTYGSYNKSQESMLQYSQFETTCNNIIALDKEMGLAVSPPAHEETPSPPRKKQKKKKKKENYLQYKLSIPLPYTDSWSCVRTRGTVFPKHWRSTFLSKKVIVQLVHTIVYFTCLRTYKHCT